MLFNIFNKNKCHNCRKIFRKGYLVEVNNYEVFGSNKSYCVECVRIINDCAGINDKLRTIAAEIYENPGKVKEHNSLCDVASKIISIVRIDKRNYKE